MMMKKEVWLYLWSLVILGVILIAPGLALASDITNAHYYGTVRGTNNSSTAATNVSGNFTANTAAWIAAGVLNSSANNCAIRNSSGTDTAFQPGAPGYPWIVFFSSIPGNASSDATLYTDDVTGGKIRWFPGTTGGTTADSASLEYSSNFTQTISGYYNTPASAVGANITGKTDAFREYVSGTGNITAKIRNVAGNTNNITPDSAGDNTSIASQFPAATLHWDKVDDPPATPDDACPTY